jgi:hypothetical protein
MPIGLSLRIWCERWGWISDLPTEMCSNIGLRNLAFWVPSTFTVLRTGVYFFYF